jgi:glycerophosphoryl diester phosphodiesterase
MQFLAHRGFWEKPEEKNSPAALRRALAGGYGVETDFRDFAQQLVIAHDPAGPQAQAAAEFFALYAELNCAAPLALNIKADGLRTMLKTLLQTHGIKNYFCFDMSAPEMLGYARAGLRFFTRESEIEPAPALYEPAAGVWVDMFHGDWVQPRDVEKHLAAGKQVALVSPELHQRPHLEFWARLRDAGLGRRAGVMLCTDLPQAAEEFFHD